MTDPVATRTSPKCLGRVRGSKTLANAPTKRSTLPAPDNVLWCGGNCTRLFVHDINSGCCCWAGRRFRSTPPRRKFVLPYAQQEKSRRLMSQRAFPVCVSMVLDVSFYMRYGTVKVLIRIVWTTITQSQENCLIIFSIWPLLLLLENWLDFSFFLSFFLSFLHCCFNGDNKLNIIHTCSA